MMTKYSNFKILGNPKKIFSIFLIGILLTFNSPTISNILGLTISSETGILTHKSYTNLTLNNTVSFELNSTSYTDEVHLNFTSINETKDFIINGDFNTSSLGWSAQNETDVKYEWTSNGPMGSKGISINLTGTNSRKYFRPMNDSTGIEKFWEINGWVFTNNDSADFTQALDPLETHPPGDGTGSIMHKYDVVSSTGIANSSYQFFYNASYPLINTTLLYYYKWNIPTAPQCTIRLSTYIITPQSKTYKLEGSEVLLSTSGTGLFQQMKLINIQKYFNYTGNYKLILSSNHSHTGFSGVSTIYFDYIDLNFTWGLKEFNQNDTISWNQSINFNRGVFSDGILNYSLYLTEKFEHINKSDIFLTTWINDQRIKAYPLTFMANNTWIVNSTNIDKSIIGTGIIKVAFGLFFNTTAYVFSNETFSLYLDNISLVIGSNPDPLQVELKVYDPSINKTFTVDRDIYNHDYVKISNNSFIWNPGLTHYMNVTCNSSNVLVSLNLTYFVYQIGGDGNDGNVEPPITNYYDAIPLMIILILVMVISSSLYVIRFQKRMFLNPKYDYVKKLKFKKKLSTKLKRDEPIIPKKRCTSCGKYVNATAKFCEHCGQTL